MANTVNVRITGDASSLKTATDSAAKSVENLGNQAEKAVPNGKDPLDPIGKKIDLNNLMNATDTIAGVGTKVLDIGKKSIESAANVNAMNSTFKQTFGDQLPYATSQVDKLSKAYDILPNRIKPSYQQFTAMFKGLGLDTKDAADKATQAMRISANAAAYYDKSLEESNSSLQSFVKGNYEGGESIGLFANDTQMAAFATKNNLIPATEGAKKASEELSLAAEKATKKQQEAIAKHGENSIEAREAGLKLKKVQEEISEELGPQQQKWADLDEATKQAVRLDYAENMMVQAGAIDEVGKMTGQASRESGEYENQMGNMNQAIEDFYATLGKDVLPTFLDILKQGLTVVQGAAKAFDALPTPVKNVIFVVGGLLALFAQLAPVITAVIAIMGALEGVALLPIIGVIAAVIAAVTAAILIFKNWGAITDWISEKWNAFKEWIGEWWANMAQGFADLWNQVKENASTSWNGIKDTLSQIWNAISGAVGGFVSGVSKAVSDRWNEIKTNTSNKWNEIKTVISNVWNAIKAFVTNAINGVKSVVSNGWNSIKQVTSNLWNGIKSVVSSVWNGIKSLISNGVNGAKSAVTNGWNAIKSVTSNVFNGVKSIASNTWNNIKNAMTSPIQAAQNVISGIVNRIKSLFNFRLKFPSIDIPHIPLPHFTISGSFNPLKGKIPSVGINWYAKGGLFSSPSIIGVGEAGDEAVLPLKDSVLGRIANGIIRNMPNAGYTEQYRTNPVVNQIEVNWTGDVDSPDRLNQLTDAIVEKITDNNTPAFA